MLASSGSSFNWKYTSIVNPASVGYGTSVVPGASNAEGSWTQVASSANVDNDVCMFTLRVANGNTTATIKDHLLDVGVDQAGGTSYTAAISNIICGQSDQGSSQGIMFVFPLRIKAGASVAVRVQGVAATAGTVTVRAVFYGLPSRPECVVVGAYSQTVGTITNSGGVSVTPGNSNAEGSWVSLGTTSVDLWWWQLCVQLSNAVSINQLYHFDLAYGDATNKVMILENMYVAIPGSTERLIFLGNLTNFMECYREVPSGSTIYVRATCAATTDTGWNVVAVGIGG